jgi:hypothetical protein
MRMQTAEAVRGNSGNLFRFRMKIRSDAGKHQTLEAILKYPSN